MARQIINLGAAANDTTGTKARAGGQIINENFEEVYTLIEILSRIDIITENKGFSLVGNDLTINADWEWIINNEIYTNPDAVVFTDIALSASGNSRLVYVVPNAMNGFDMLDGEETTGTPVAPELTNGGMYVTYFEVTDSEIGTPADGYDGNALNDKLSKGGYEGTAQTLSNRIDNYDNYGKKQYESYWRDISLTGAVTDLDLSTNTESTSLNFTNAITELNSVIFSPLVVQPYNGKDFYIKNSQAASFLIKHEIGNIATEQRYIFSLPGEVDLELKPKQIAHFKLTTSGDRGKIELVGVVLDESNLMHLTGDEEVDGNKTFLQPVSGEDAVNPEHLVTLSQIEAADADTLAAANAYTDSKVSSVYKIKPSVADFASLPSLGNTEGDTRNTLDTGMNYVWDGTVWDAIGTTIDVSGKEDTSNKTGTVVGNEASTSLYLHILGAVTYFQQKLTDSIFGAFINGLTSKTTPVDADIFSYVDTEDSNKLKKFTWANIKATLLTYFDTQYKKVELSYALSDETTNLTVGTLITFRMPFAMTLTSVRASVNTAPTVSSIIVDVKESGASIFSTLLSIDATEKTSVTAATPAVISDSSLADDAEITISTTQIGSGVAGAGLKITLIGTRT